MNYETGKNYIKITYFLSNGLNKQKMLKANYDLCVFMSYISDIELLIDERITKRPSMELFASRSPFSSDDPSPSA